MSHQCAPLGKRKRSLTRFYWLYFFFFKTENDRCTTGLKQTLTLNLLTPTKRYQKCTIVLIHILKVWHFPTILSSCNIYTNTILYTVEIHNPVCPLSGTLTLHPSSFQWSKTWSTLSKSLWTVAVCRGVKTPGQYYIIWIIKYPFNPNPKPKAKTNTPLIQLTNICTTLIQRLLENNLDTVFIHYCLIVSAAAVSSQSKGGRVQEIYGGQEGQLVRRGPLSRLSCSAKCVKAQLCGQVWHRAGCCGVFMVHCSPQKEQSFFSSWFLWWRLHI